ncbi:MAG: DNA recombination protein RmuC [Ignavibacteriae bacterium]|nr:DNA recombination protein RmuC [Ignavibacteriota bacterium]MCB9242079.1 DNA recombination protein RmuC [Ignavibacteriales bacterium]
MDPVLYIILAVLLVAVILLFFLVKKSGSTQSDTNRQLVDVSSKLLESINEQKTQIAIQNEKLESQRNDTFNALNKFQSDINAFREEVSRNLSNANFHLQSSNKVIGDVKERFGEIMETTKHIYNVGKNISELENILKAPKLRGNLGEYLLEELLKQILPSESYSKSHKFNSGERVDFVIHLGDKLVPVDSKFPLENFRKYLSSKDEQERELFYRESLKNVRKHIDDIAKKYIRPDEKTFDFAMMYIPAENVYYEVIVRDTVYRDEKSLYLYAMEKRVIPVSPNSMFAYLQSILIGLKGMEVEKNAEQIISNMAMLNIELDKFADEFKVMGSHLVNAGKKYRDAEKRLDHFENKLGNIMPKDQLLGRDEDELDDGTELRLIK